MDPLYSPSWYRVAELRMERSADLVFHRHVYRNEVWYVVRNSATGKTHRFTPAAHDLVGRLSPDRTTDEVWLAIVDRWGDDSPTQDETLRLLGVLHGDGLIRADAPPDTQALFAKAQEEERKERRSNQNPVSFRVPMVDPDAFLNRWLPWVQPLFSRAGAFVCALTLLIAAIAALKNAPELAAASDSLFEPASVVALWFAYPLVKAIHELGHAFAVKHWGGEVHEMGILFMVFLPVPYVDASASSVFPDKRKRMIVSGAGILVELFLASIATLVWLVVEPGAVRHVAYAVMLVGGISTLLFNGNPLLRFDGYYVFADALEIPNLASRSRQYLGILAQRYLLGLKTVPLPETAPGEDRWLIGYSIAAFAYQTMVMLGIALYLASEFFVIGVGLAVFTLVMRMVVPFGRNLAWLLTDPGVGQRRSRALAGSLGSFALVMLIVFALPLPLRTQTEGVTWLPEDAHVRAGAEGFVVELLAEPHSPVERGAALVRTRDPAHVARLRVLEAERRELRQRVQSLAGDDRVQAEIARDQLADADASLARAREEGAELIIHSPSDGLFVLDGGRDPVGRYVAKGEVVGYVVDLGAPTARVVVTQSEIALLRERTDATWVRVAHAPGAVLPGRIMREVPAGTGRLPSRALGTSGGGPFPVEPSDPDGVRTLEPVFQFDVALPAGSMRAAGERVYVRFDHGTEPLIGRSVRALRRLFLRQLGV